MVEKSVHVGLDIGTSSVKVVVSEYAKNQLNVIGVGVERSTGVNRGIIVDIDATVEAIKKAVAKAEQRANVSINSVVVGVPSTQIAIEPCHGMIAVSSENREITDKDVDNVISAAKVRSVPPEREIISILPEEFVVDGFDGIKDPRGMIGVRLELFAYLVTGPKTIVHNIRRVVAKAGLTISELVLQPLATSKSALTPGERSFGTVLIDMGGGQTTAAAIHDDQVKFVYIDQEGGDYVTRDISTVLNVTYENAESIKRDYGYVLDNGSEEHSYFLSEVVGHKDPIRVEESYLSEIIEARLVQTFEHIKQALDSVDALALPGGVVLTGGACVLPGVVELAQQVFGVAVRLYVPAQMGLRHPSFAQALGLLNYTVSLDDIHHVAQLDISASRNQASQANRPKNTELRQASPVQPSPQVHVQTASPAQKPAVADVEELADEQEPEESRGFIGKIGSRFRNFFDALGEE